MLLNRLQWDTFSYAVQLVCRDLDINIYTLNDRYESRKNQESLKYGVNWGAFGTQDADTTLAFAAKLQEAAQIAQMLTSMEIIYTYTVEGPEMEKEERMKYVKALVEMIKLQMPEMVVAVLNKMEM